MQAVVHGVENTVSQEVQVLAIGIKRGRDIFENWLGHEMGFAGLQAAEFDSGFLIREGEAIGQPASIRRPGKAPYTAVVAAIKHARGTCLQVNREQFIAMIGNGNHVTGGRNNHRNGSSKLDIGKRLRLAAPFGIEDEQALATGCVVDGNQTLAIIEPVQIAIAHAIGFTMLEYRSFPVAH